MTEYVYFDTCVFIELLEQANQSRLEACKELWAKAAKKELIIVTSAATIVEVNKLPGSTALPEDQSRQILTFFRNAIITVRSVDRKIAEAAHDLTRIHGLTNLDAIHVATAIDSRVRTSTLYTYDAPKKKRKSLIKHDGKIGTPALAIKLPPDPVKGTVFDPDVSGAGEEKSETEPPDRTSTQS